MSAQMESRVWLLSSSLSYISVWVYLEAFGEVQEVSILFGVDVHGDEGEVIFIELET